MFRTTLLLLIATMLACPLRCSAHEAAAWGDAAAASGGCSSCVCCQSVPADQPALGAPESKCPDSGCDCGNCICHGAVLEDGAEVLFASVDCFAGIVSLPALDPSQLSADFVGSIDTLSRRNVYPDGRAARIAHQSLLI